MPSNYTGVSSNFTPGPVVIGEPIDGDADNGATFQSPLSQAADAIANTVDRIENALFGPAILRTTTAVFASGGLGGGGGSTGTLAFASSLGNIGRFVLVGNNGAGTPVCVTSDDAGLTWTTQASFATAFGANNPNAVSWNGSLFLAVGNGGKIATSSDGVTWTARTSGVATALWTIAWSPAKTLWIVGGSSTVVLTSPDGTTWTSRATGQTAGQVQVMWGAGPALFVAATASVGTANSIATSPDGVTWTLRTAPVTNMFSLGYFGFSTPVFLLTSTTANTLWTSPDGINWTQRASNIFNGGSSFFYSARSAACSTGGSTGQMFTSRDGVTWVSRPLPATGTAGGGCSIGVLAFGGMWYPAFNGTAIGLAAGPLFPFP